MKHVISLTIPARFVSHPVRVRGLKRLLKR